MTVAPCENNACACVCHLVLESVHLIKVCGHSERGGAIEYIMGLGGVVVRPGGPHRAILLQPHAELVTACNGLDACVHGQWTNPVDGYDRNRACIEVYM